MAPRLNYDCLVLIAKALPGKSLIRFAYADKTLYKLLRSSHQKVIRDNLIEHRATMGWPYNPESIVVHAILNDNHYAMNQILDCVNFKEFFMDQACSKMFLLNIIHICLQLDGKLCLEVIEHRIRTCTESSEHDATEDS